MTIRAALIVVLVNTLVTLALGASYVTWLAPPAPPRLATIDVAELYRLKEALVASVLVKPNTTADERAELLKQVSAFGIELSRLMQTLPHECGCVILARGAIAGNPAGLLDLTPELRRRLGL